MSHKIDFTTYQLDVEQKVGTWINGKTLYRKTITATANIPAATTIAMGVQIVSFDATMTFVRHAEVMLDLGGGIFQMLTVNGEMTQVSSFHHQNSVSLWAIRASSKTLAFYSSMANRITGTFYITLEYTKD